MRRNNTAPEEKGPQVPAYIVTFSDMVTLLLTFFVLLISMSQPKYQDTEIFNKGREAFLKNIENFGLGVLPGLAKKPKFGSVKQKYFISKPEDVTGDRSIDAREEDIRRTFRKLSMKVDARQSNIVANGSNIVITGIKFSSDDVTLSKSGKRFLREFSASLEAKYNLEPIKLCVLGLAGEKKTSKQQWIASAKRADAVREFLKNTFSSDINWPIYSWGAGSGGIWVDQDSPMSKDSHILITVLR